jgi:hypothetical protein
MVSKPEKYPEAPIAPLYPRNPTAMGPVAVTDTPPVNPGRKKVFHSEVPVTDLSAVFKVVVEIVDPKLVPYLTEISELGMVAEANMVIPPEMAAPAIASIVGILSTELLSRQFTGAIKLISPVAVDTLPERD